MYVTNIYLYLGLLLCSWKVCAFQDNLLKRAREQHKTKALSHNDITQLASLSDVPYINSVLDNILIPRVVGSPGHELVFNYISEELKKLHWKVEVDQFVATTPIFGNLTFKNIIASLNPDAERYLVLACHYDSKYFSREIFVGAIDSAVPCAMMLEIARTMAREFNSIKKDALSLRLIFFDGEEAFDEWGPRDSIYGARHLAHKLHHDQKDLGGRQSVSALEQIDALILLDLIGAKHPQFLSYFEDTQKWFNRLHEIEKITHRLQLLKSYRRMIFQLGRSYGRIEDDHLPFLIRGVPILHLIATPFPPEWHTPADDRSLIDMDTVVNINLILKVFISEYLHILFTNKKEYMPNSQEYFEEDGKKWTSWKSAFWSKLEQVDEEDYRSDKEL